MQDLKYTEILARNKELASKAQGTVLKIGILSNVTVHQSKEILELALRQEQIAPEITFGNFDTIAQDAALQQGKDIVMVWYDMMALAKVAAPFFEALTKQQYAALQQRLFAELSIVFQNLKDIPAVIINNFSAAWATPRYVPNSLLDQFVAEANAYLQQHKSNNTTLVAIDKIFCSLGIKQCVDLRFFESAGAPYTIHFYKAYAESIYNVCLRKAGKLKKAIIFDCDNTLWKGIIGEDGQEGIDMSPQSALGKHFYEVQQIAQWLSKQGVLVGLCSKNNEEEVNAVLDNHPEMLLKQADIVLKKINWQDKATNLKNMAAELNIGLDSIVFVDDAAFEIELIQQTIPEMKTFQVPSHTSNYPAALAQFVYRYFEPACTSEDGLKTQLYKQEASRSEAKQAAISIDDYLASLAIKIKISYNDESQITRIAQLSQKTNQFNLCTLRYTEAEVQAMMAQSQYLFFSLGVSDKFGDSGITGLAVVKMEQDNKATIENFMLSCRVIGRNIEYVFLNQLLFQLKEQRIIEVAAQYQSTNRNEQVSRFYDHAGFTPIASSAEKTDYLYCLKNLVQHNYPYIQHTNS